MKTPAKILIVLILAAVAQIPRNGKADVLHMTDAVWRACGTNGCYSLSIDTGGVSRFIPRQLFAKNIHLNLYYKGRQSHPTQTLTADHGYWMQDRNIWVLVDVKSKDKKLRTRQDLYFSPSTLKFADAAF